MLYFFYVSGRELTIRMAQPSHLGPNNFTIGNDARDTKPSLMSVFKQDYPVHDQYGRSDIARPPRLGDVMHCDERVRERASETVYNSLCECFLLMISTYV